jgi:cytochrome c-type biogenesis protein CcmF
VIAAIAIPLMMGMFSMLAALGFLLATFVIVSAAMQLATRFKMHPGASLFTKLKANSFSYYGMMIAHVGMGVLVFGVTMVNTFEQKQELNMKPGQAAEVAGFRFVFNEIGQKPGSNFSSTYASFTATKVGDPGGWSLEMKPEKRTYTVSGQTMTEAAIKSSLFRDVYVSIGEPLPNGEWLVGLFVKPFVNWMWIGCLMMALGGFLCVADKRYRVGKKVAEINKPKIATQPNKSNEPNKVPNITAA